MASAYGTLLGNMMEGVTCEDDMGFPFGGGLTQKEVDWLINREWARTPADILERRTKLGLSTGPDTEAALAHYMEGLMP
jgi:glycerol-3-phosphate dehydrogenase